ncbi:response regulator receiver domain protein [Caenispirillum salinarum AK4]|uniref:Response regulator receiver domain protein n=1 Tax=Caenispirillum salinarum AK4 TaxID=1238182 RepID=K9GZK4_9PROT|nr:response regulator [Caenispirillum salinarum]EKV30174.1 response regulator receiver domain protein [Caenispirillum salinarum AK4]
MAHTYFFNNVTAVVADARKPRLQVLRSSLYYMGFRDTEWAETVQDLEEVAERVKPDIIIAAMDLPGGDAGAYFRRIRTGMSRVDPFTPIIAVLSEAAPDTVRRGVDSGADDLLIHPWSEGYLDQRLHNLIHARKPFVVTSSYVGPERRAVPRPGPQAPTITPVNVLEAKALKRKDADAVAGDQQACRRALSAHRVRALAGLIVGLIGDINGRYARGMVMDDANARDLARLTRAAEEAHLQGRLMRDTTCAKDMMADVARHARLCRDAQEFGRIASIAELEALAGRLADAFDLDTALLLDKPAAGDAAAGTDRAPRVAAE